MPDRVRGCRMVELSTIPDVRGSIVVAEVGDHLSFPIERAYWLHGVPEGAHRGGHAHRELQQVLVAVAGSLTVHLDDGVVQASFPLDRPDRGLLIGPMVWRELSDFSAGAVCLVLASHRYDEADYFRDPDTFRAALTS
jgi:hypothetical protein